MGLSITTAREKTMTDMMKPATLLVTVSTLRGDMIEGAPWQVHYKTPAGLDFFRQTLPADYDLERVKYIATLEVATNADIATANIQRW
jgi:hypothetical protein